MSILPALSDLLIEQVNVTNEVTVTVRAASPTASCPCCGTICKRIQSQYTRTLRDLPASGRPVHLLVRVRRFFCHENSCPRKIFAERFPSLTLPRVKFTLRLQEALREIGFALGGEARGYKGSPKAMYNYLATLRAPQSDSCKSTPPRPQERKSIPSSPAPLENFSAQRATWLFVCQPEKLDERQQAELALIRQASPSAETCAGYIGYPFPKKRRRWCSQILYCSIFPLGKMAIKLLTLLRTALFENGYPM